MFAYAVYCCCGGYYLVDCSDVLEKSPFEASVAAAPRLASDICCFEVGSMLLGCGGSVVRERCVDNP